MQLLRSLLLLAPSIALTLAAPVRQAIPLTSDALTYLETGWTAKNITVFHAHPRNKSASYITFTLVDVNKGLTLNTNCTHLEPAGSSVRINDDSVAYPCTDYTATFRYNGSHIFISRSYIDHGFGPPGLDLVTFFGNAGPQYTTTNVYGGTMQTAASLKIAATSAVG